MQLSILNRLAFSYFIIFSMLVGVSLFSIYRFSNLNKEIRSLVHVDTVVFEYSHQLSDSLLSMSRNNQKYLLLKDEKLKANYIKSSEEFDRLLQESINKADNDVIVDHLSSISDKHLQLSQLIEKEDQFVNDAIPYSSDLFAKQKKMLTATIIKQLTNLRRESEKNIFRKVASLGESGEKAKNVIILIVFCALTTSLLVAIIITNSIKKPLDTIRAKTLQIAEGNFNKDLQIQSPPEVAQLASAINNMCHKLQEVDDIKTDFFSHMSHELRTPLTSIREGTSMILEGLGGEITEKQHHILSIVVEECNRLISLVNSLLDLAKMEAGMQKYQFSETQLSELVKQSLDLLGPLAEAKKISIKSSINESHIVNVDQERILQVLNNIVGNAIKFTEQNGEIKLEAVTRGKMLEVAVHDTGRGIPNDHLETIFLKFHQIKPAKGDMIKGTGIGLATVKQIILTHGGKVWATSHIGQGSSFYATLPLA